MKRAENIINVYWTENNGPERFIDRVAMALCRSGLIVADDAWPLEDSRGEPCGVLAHVVGPKLLVDFIAWTTNTHFGKANRINVEVKSGRIVNAEEIQ